MKTNVGRRQRVIVWLGVACLGLMPVGSISAQEPKLRDTLKICFSLGNKKRPKQFPDQPKTGVVRMVLMKK